MCYRGPVDGSESYSYNWKVTALASWCLPACLHDCFQFSSISQRVLDYHLTDILALSALIARVSSVWKVDMPIPDQPATVLGKLDHVAF